MKSMGILLGSIIVGMMTVLAKQDAATECRYFFYGLIVSHSLTPESPEKICQWDCQKVAVVGCGISLKAVVPFTFELPQFV